jgi:inorganic pyrophosphatase
VDDLTRLAHKLNPHAATCRVVIETSKGRRSKYDYDRKSGLFRLKTLLPEGLSFPLDFGFIPSTLAEDGDPEDVMVLADEAMPTGALADVRLLGVIEAEQDQNGKVWRNDRILAAASVSHLYANVRSVRDLGQAYVDNLTQFWVNKDALEGKAFRVLGVEGPARAVALIETASAAAMKWA